MKHINKFIFMMQSMLAMMLMAMVSDAFAQTSDWAISGSAVITQQTATTSHIQNEAAGSADLLIQRQYSAGNMLAHIETSSTSRSNGVSAILPEANADVGTARDANNHGRIQLSQLYYTHSFSDNKKIAAGLLDVSGFFEQSRLASDETTQFLGAFFVGNPTIAFPDYTLGVVYEAGLSDGIVLNAALANTHGLADNPGRSYAQLLSMGGNKGVFGISSVSWKQKKWLLRAGIWLKSTKQQALNPTHHHEENYGTYILAEYKHDPHAVNIRVGMANPDVSQGAAFASVAYRYQFRLLTIGAAMGRMFLSVHQPASTLSDTDQYETFLRYTLGHGLFLSGDMQRIVNSNYGIHPENKNHHANIYGVRLTWLYP